MWEIAKFNPPQWARLTKDGPIILGPFERKILEAAEVMVTTNDWNAVEALCDIRLARSQRQDFREGFLMTVEVKRMKKLQASQGAA